LTIYFDFIFYDVTKLNSVKFPISVTTQDWGADMVSIIIIIINNFIMEVVFEIQVHKVVAGDKKVPTYSKLFSGCRVGVLICFFPNRFIGNLKRARHKFKNLSEVKI